jgi:hypothetical protein
MSRRSARTAVLSLAAAALGLAALVPAPSYAGESRAAKLDQAAAAPSTPSDHQAPPNAQQAMEEYAKLAAPGPQHQRLASLVGTWKVTGKGWMAPGQPPMEMTGTSSATAIMGGRYVQGVHTGNFMGQKFEGRETDGYDNVTHQYWSTWMDSMGTGVMVSRGTCDDPCKTLTEIGEEVDPMTGKAQKEKVVTTFVDGDTYTMQMYMVGGAPDGGDFKVMELVAKRQK